MRQIPIFTFINKMDRPGQEPLELLDEIESELGLLTFAVNWPIGSGELFRGVVERATKEVVLFSRAERGKQSNEIRLKINDPELKNLVEEELLTKALEEIEILDEAGCDLNQELILSGELTPVFFGSAMTNFGVRPFLDNFLDLSQGPVARNSFDGPIVPTRESFSGFVFKLQANICLLYTSPSPRD